MLTMKRLRLILVALAMVLVTVAMATEPSKTTVKYHGKKYYVHKVQEGDTLYSLATVYGVSQESIIEINGLSSSDLMLGAMLYVPIADGAEDKKGAARGESKRHAEGKKRQVEEDVHIVAPGETIYSLSRTYGLTQDELLELNGLSDASELKAGMELCVQKSGNARGNKAECDARNGDHSSRNDNEGEMYLDGEELAAESVACDLQTEMEFLEEEASTSLFTKVEPNMMLQVTLLLPFHARGESKENIVDFYRGVLLAMEDLKNSGYSIELTVLDSERNAEHISDMILYGEINAQLIIGPVYNEEFAPLLSYAAENNIPIVSPLQYVDYDCPVLFNMPAPAELKGAPVAGLLDGSREVIKIYASNNDTTFINEVNSIATNSSEVALNFQFNRGSYFYTRNSNGSNGSLVNIEELMRTKSEKVFVVMASSATDVDRILTTLSSTKSSIRGRGLTYGDYTVLGNREWLKMTSIDHDIFFHNDVVFVVPYYANRIDEVVRLFDGRYIASFGALPSRTSYRGYDAAMIFCRMMYEGFDGFLDVTHTPLATPYKFEYRDGAYTNTNWVRQHYRHDSKIVVE